MEPISRLSGYRDYFGNEVSFLSLPYRRTRLMIRRNANRWYKTLDGSHSAENLDLTIQESRQIMTGLSFLSSSITCNRPEIALKLAGNRCNRQNVLSTDEPPCGMGWRRLTGRSTKTFNIVKGLLIFQQGHLGSIWRDRIAVCQDFAHIMLSVLRTAGVYPSRYVCGYIETSTNLREKTV